MDGVGQMDRFESHSINKATRSSGRFRGSGRGGAASPKVLRQYISRFPQASVLVIGDLILDHYIWACEPHLAGSPCGVMLIPSP